MKVFALSAVFCLALLALTVWFVATPVYAAGATANCGPGGGTISCSGTNCSSNDATLTNGGLLHMPPKQWLLRHQELHLQR